MLIVLLYNPTLNKILSLISYLILSNNLQSKPILQILYMAIVLYTPSLALQVGKFWLGHLYGNALLGTMM